MTERNASGRFLYIIPLLLFGAAGWFAFARDSGSASAAEPATDQRDARRFKVVAGGLVEDTATGIRRPLAEGQDLAEAFPESEIANVDDLRFGRGPRPVLLSVGAIGLESEVAPIGVDENRALAVPERADIVGWWSGGAVPGENGPTVLVGHYDSKKAPGVFENLRKLGPGARIVIEQSDGSVFLYDVTLVEHLSKTEFPTDAVYGPTRTSTLRLVTCGGEFDNETRHYVDNTIVYANLAAPPPPELRADRPITKTSENVPILADPSLLGVDGGAGASVTSSPPTTTAADSTTTTTALVAPVATTPVGGVTATTVPASGTAPITTPTEVASTTTTPASSTLPPSSALPPSSTLPPLTTIVVTPTAPPSSVPGTTIAIEPGTPPATSVIGGQPA